MRFRAGLPWTHKACDLSFYNFSLAQILAKRCPGLVAEFGVHKGQSLKEIAEAIAPQKVYGFDSFKGIAEAWGDFPKGYWAVDYLKETYPDTAELVVGWFADTLPGFVKEHPDPFGYCLINSGLYSAARDVLTNIKDRIIVGTILHFGEIKCVTGCDHEIRAFNEYLEVSDTEWEVIGQTGIWNAAFKRTA